MKHAKMLEKVKNSTLRDEGITLIALIITIIIMLILVGVSIQVVINSGLFGNAGKAVEYTQSAINSEQELANGRMQIGGVWYNSTDDYLTEDMNVYIGFNYFNIEKRIIMENFFK